MAEPLKGALGFRWEHQGPEGFVQRPPSRLVNRVRNKPCASELQHAFPTSLGPCRQVASQQVLPGARVATPVPDAPPVCTA